MKRLILIIFAVATTLNANFVDGPANIRDDKNGKLIFTLESTAEVQVIKKEENWYFIGWSGLILTQDISNEEVKKGTILFNEKKEKVGIISTDMKVLTMWTEDKFTYCSLTGHTHKENIPDYKTNNEIYDELLILEQIKTEDVLKYFKKSKYQSIFTDKKLAGFESIVITENNDISQTYDSIFIFKNNNLTAIVHSQNYKSAKFIDSYITKRNMKISFLQKFNKEVKDQIIKELNIFLTSAG